MGTFFRLTRPHLAAGPLPDWLPGIVPSRKGRWGCRYRHQLTRIEIAKNMAAGPIPPASAEENFSFRLSPPIRHGLGQISRGDIRAAEKLGVIPADAKLTPRPRGSPPGTLVLDTLYLHERLVRRGFQHALIAVAQRGDPAPPPKASSLIRVRSIAINQQHTKPWGCYAGGGLTSTRPKITGRHTELF